VTRPTPTPNAGDDRRPLAELIQAGIDHPLGRRRLLAGAALGLAAPVLGSALRAAPAAFGLRRARQAATPTADEPGRAAYRRATQPLRPPGQPLVGGALTIGFPAAAEPATLHPWLTTGAGPDLLAGVMDGLLRWDADQRLQPALATGFDLSQDGRTYTFTLRDGVTFHDGTPFTSADVAASWRALPHPAFAATRPAGWDKIYAIETPDAATLVVRTTEPYAPFLATVATAPVCPAAALAAGISPFLDRFAANPIGTGPLRLAEWVPGERLALERFDRPWGEPSRLDRVEARFVADLDAQLAGLADGGLGLIGGAGGIPPGRVDAALAIPGITVVEHATQNWQHLDLKQIGFLRETRVRQALDFATPRQRIVDELLAGRAIPAVADQAPGSWAYNPTIEPRPYDPERATALLDQARLRPNRDGLRERDGEPFRIELWGVAGDPLAEEIIALIADSWRGIGLDVAPRFGEAATLWGPMGYQFSDRMTAALYTWTNGNDPDNMFYWHSSQIPLSPTAGGGNLPAFFHPYAFQEVIDALTAEAAATFDRDERRALYWQIQELLAREVPVIFLYWERGFAAAAADVGGFWPTPFTPLLWNVAEWYLANPTEAPPEGTPVSGQVDRLAPA